MEAAEALRALEALLESVGGRQRLLLVAERRAGEAPRRALLESFSRDLFGEAAEGGDGGAEKGGGGAWLARTRAGRRWPWCPLALVLCRPDVGPARRAWRRLGELMRDVHGQLAPNAGLVAVLVGEGDGPARPEAEREAARLRLEALLRRACGRRRPALHAALQAAHYSPGSPQGAAPVRAAALRALRAALQLRAAGLETEKQRLPALLRCFPWGGRSQKTAGSLDKPEHTSGDGQPAQQLPPYSAFDSPSLYLEILHFLQKGALQDQKPKDASLFICRNEGFKHYVQDCLKNLAGKQRINEQMKISNFYAGVGEAPATVKHFQAFLFSVRDPFSNYLTALSKLLSPRLFLPCKNKTLTQVGGPSHRLAAKRSRANHVKELSYA